jgi:Zn-dependent protease
MRNFTIGHVWGIPIRINTSLLIFLPILAWLIGSGGQIEIYAPVIESWTGVGLDVSALRAGSMPWVIGITAAVGLFLSVTLHELGHSWVALRYGLEIESITLWILGGMAALSEIPREWDREFRIAIAGPITSFAVGGVAYGVAQVVPPSLPVVRFVVGWLAIMNVILAVFNLLPAFPMDGGRILRAVLARNRPYGTATRIAGRVGVVFAVLFAVVGVLSFNLIMVLLAFFIYGAATTESQTVLVDELLDELTVRDIAGGELRTIDGAESVDVFGDRLLQDRETVFAVTDDAGAVIGVVSLADLQAVGTDRSAVTVASIARQPPRVLATDDAFDSLVKLEQSRSDSALIEEAGEVVGILTRADFSHAITVRKGFQSSFGP